MDLKAKPVLVTGATGYVGGRLVPQLLNAGYRVRALGRSVAKLQGRPWGSHPLVELAKGDVLDYDSLAQAAQGCGAAFYLVHSMLADPRSYSDTDRRAARNMVQAAAAAGLDRIIYLGGLGGASDPHLSEHLRSRYEVARILQSGPVPATFLRAAMILGSGSASFEIMRYLVDRLPVMITPRWVHNPVQPIAITNVLNYLQGCLEHDEVKGQTFDIGGPDILTYRQLFDIYAEEAGLRRRLIIPVPVLTPKLSSYWIHLVTPVPAAIAQPLALGLRNPVICQENRIRDIIPQELLTCRETIRRALQKVRSSSRAWTPAGWTRARWSRRSGSIAGTPTMPGAPSCPAASGRCWTQPRNRSGPLSPGSAGTPAITSAPACGACGARWIGSSGASAFEADGGTRRSSPPGTPWISGGCWRWSRPIASCCWRR